MEILIAGIGGAIIVWLLVTKGGNGSTGSTGGGPSSGDVCTTPTSLQGVGISTLSSSGSPAGDGGKMIRAENPGNPGFIRTLPLPPKPSTPTIFNQKRIRPDGPMFIYPVSTAGNSTVTRQNRLSLSQP